MERSAINTRQHTTHLALLLLAGAWLFPLGWTILSSFKTSRVAIFERPFAIPEGITFANYEQAFHVDRHDYFIAKSPLLANLSP